MNKSIQDALMSGNIRDAMNEWRRHQPASVEDTVQFGSGLFQLYYLKEAKECFAILLDRDDVSETNLLGIAKLWFGIGRFETSSLYSGKALAANGKDPDLVAMHASNLTRSKRSEEAELLLREALAAHPGHARCVRQLAHLLRTVGELEQSRILLESCLRDYPSADDWRLQYELGYVQDRCGEYSQAIHSLEQAKASLAAESAKHLGAWQQTSQRQWECTQLLDKAMLNRWRQGRFEFQTVLMAGFPRSGTTLLETILSRHPRCIGTDETGILASLYRDPIIMQAASAQEAMAELESFEPEDLQLGREEYLRCTEAYMGEPLEGRILIEKEPLMTADLHVPLRLFPDCKILMPLRDPRDVVISFYFTIVPLAANSVAARSLADSCHYYAEVMRHWLVLREHLPRECWMEVRYEDLLSAPEAQTRALASFLGIDWTDDLLDSKKSQTKAVSTPTYSDVSKPLYQRSRERWRHYEIELSPHLELLEPFIEAFGYGE